MDLHGTFIGTESNHYIHLLCVYRRNPGKFRTTKEEYFVEVHATFLKTVFSFLFDSKVFPALTRSVKIPIHVQPLPKRDRINRRRNSPNHSHSHTYCRDSNTNTPVLVGSCYQLHRNIPPNQSSYILYNSSQGRGDVGIRNVNVTICPLMYNCYCVYKCNHDCRHNYYYHTCSNYLNGKKYGHLLKNTARGLCRND